VETIASPLSATTTLHEKLKPVQMLLSLAPAIGLLVFSSNFNSLVAWTTGEK